MAEPVSQPTQSSGQDLLAVLGDHWGEVAVFLIIICFAGFFGGFLFHLRAVMNARSDPKTSTQELRETVRASYMNNGLVGIAGSLAIFVFVPDAVLIGKEITGQGIVKLFGFLVFGGYAAPALIDATVANVVGRLRTVEENTKSLTENTEVLHGKNEELNHLVETMQNKVEYDNEAVARFYEILGSAEVSDGMMREFNDAVQEASNTTRLQLWALARDIRKANWSSNKIKMERTIPVFLGLVKTMNTSEYHWVQAEVGFCYKDKTEPDYEKAIEYLSRAIRMRDETGVRLSGSYEFNRAICLIELQKSEQRRGRADAMNSEIIQDLEIASKSEEWIARIHDSEAIQRWLDAQADWCSARGTNIEHLRGVLPTVIETIRPETRRIGSA